MKSKIGHYNCSGSKSGISDGDYSIDWSDEKMNSYAIWKAGMWAFSSFKTQKAAYDFMLQEFTKVEKIED